MSDADRLEQQIQGLDLVRALGQPSILAERAASALVVVGARC